MSLKFAAVATPVPNMRVWGATRGSHTFIISIDDKYDGHISASVKVSGATPFDGGRLDLGTFDSFLAAIRACEEFKPS